MDQKKALTQLLRTITPPGTQKALHARLISTPLGPLIAVTDEAKLYFLEFFDQNRIEPKLQQLQKQTAALIAPGTSAPLSLIEHELHAYFKGKLTHFTTPCAYNGSPFQKTVWNLLRTIAYGHTQSYQQVAQALGNSLAYRAVARANSTNQCAIIIPCHRVIYADGTLGGYAAGIERKKWLLEHEKKSAHLKN